MNFLTLVLPAEQDQRNSNEKLSHADVHRERHTRQTEKDREKAQLINESHKMLAFS